MITVLTVFAVLTATVACTHLSTKPEMDVEAATQQWIAAFNRHDPKEIVSLYAEDAVFFGTVSPVLRDTPDLVWDYFKNVAAQSNSTIVLGEHRVQMFGDIAINTGFYVRKMVDAGKTVESPARFTFVYQRRAGKWLIVAHHSSVLP
jgi:uncharacterized protein (TIGR02246 family)